ncbi:MAG: hypothetical protein Q9177_003958 [Variospora cf. flavescens]
MSNEIALPKMKSTTMAPRMVRDMAAQHRIHRDHPNWISIPTSTRLFDVHWTRLVKTRKPEVAAYYPAVFSADMELQKQAMLELKSKGKGMTVHFIVNNPPQLIDRQRLFFINPPQLVHGQHLLFANPLHFVHGHLVFSSPPHLVHEYSLARSLSILACFEGYHTSDSPESVHPSVASQKQPKSSKHAPNRKALLRERLRRIVRVINATYAVCKGFPLDPETRSLAYPVHRTSETTFLIPATQSDYRALSLHMHRTDARSASIKYRKSAVLPGRSSPVSCIVLGMPSVAHEVVKALSTLIEKRISDANWSYDGKRVPISKTGAATRTLVNRGKVWKQEPDESYAITLSEFPFLVVEAADSQSRTDLSKKLHRWAQGTKGVCKVIIAFQLEKDPQVGYRVLMSVIKNKKVPHPSPGKPNGFLVVSEGVHDRVDISSQACPGSLTISATEVCPEEWELDAATKARVVTIFLAVFEFSALAAIEEKKAEDVRNAQGAPKYDSDQEDVSTPSSSESGSLVDEMMAWEVDDPQDLDYES